MTLLSLTQTHSTGQKWVLSVEFIKENFLLLNQAPFVTAEIATRNNTLNEYNELIFIEGTWQLSFGAFGENVGSY